MKRHMGLKKACFFRSNPMEVSFASGKADFCGYILNFCSRT